MGIQLNIRWDLSPSDYDAGTDASQSRWSQAFRHLLTAKNRVAERYNVGRSPDPYRPGDLVRYRLNLSSSKARDISAKMLLRWSKPVRIARKAGPNVVMLADPDTGVIVRRAHVSQLRPAYN